MTLQTRLQRLEAKHGSDDDRTILVVVDKDEAEEAERAAAEVGRPVLIVITGVPRPPERYSWRNVLAEAAERGRSILDPPMQHTEPNWRTYHGAES